MWEEEYDASQDEPTSYYIPDSEVIEVLGLQQKQYDGVFYYKDDIAAFDTSVVGYQDSELLIRKDLLDLFIEKSNKKIFFGIEGEKQFFLGGYNQKWQRKEGYFIYESEKIIGTIDNVSDN